MCDEKGTRNTAHQPVEVRELDFRLGPIRKRKKRKIPKPVPFYLSGMQSPIQGVKIKAKPEVVTSDSDGSSEKAQLCRTLAKSEIHRTPFPTHVRTHIHIHTHTLQTDKLCRQTTNSEGGSADANYGLDKDGS